LEIVKQIPEFLLLKDLNLLGWLECRNA